MSLDEIRDNIMHLLGGLYSVGIPTATAAFELGMLELTAILMLTWVRSGGTWVRLCIALSKLCSRLL